MWWSVAGSADLLQINHTQVTDLYELDANNPQFFHSVVDPIRQNDISLHDNGILAPRRAGFPKVRNAEGVGG